MSNICPTNFDLIISRAGGLSALARACDVSRQLVDGWRRVGQIPAERLGSVAAATGLSFRELRPDIFREQLPEKPHPRYVFERGQSRPSVMQNWEIIDTTRHPKTRVLGHGFTRVDAEMICRALNGEQK